MMGAKSDGWADKRNLTSISELKQIKLSVIVEYNMSSNCFFNQATSSEGSADKLIIKASAQPLLLIIICSEKVVRGVDG